MRRALLVLVLAVLVGASATASAAVNPVVAALEKTSKAKSAVVSLSGAVTSGAAGKFAIRGRMEQRGTSLRMTMSIDSPVGPQTFEMIALTERGRYVIYVRSPAFALQLPPGKKWLRIDATKSAQQLGIDLSGFTQASPEAFASFGRAIVATKRLGSASVGGQRTTHYLIHVDLAKAAAQQPSLSSTLAQLRASGIRVSRFPLHLWVGSDGHVKQMRETLAVRAGGQRVSTSLTFRYVKLNANVRIVAPKRSLVANA